MEFLKQVLAGQKKLYKSSEVKIINMPKYDELSCKNVSKLVRSDPHVQQYLKDEWCSDKQPVNKEYFFNVLNTCYPDYLPQLIKHSSSNRFKNQEKPENDETILCTQEWADELNAHPYYSR